MSKYIVLEPEQEELLVTLVEAQRRVPRSRRDKFYVVEGYTTAPTVMHPGLQSTHLGVPLSDFEALARAGLMEKSYGSEGTPRFDVTGEGFAYYAEMKQRVNEPAQRLEHEVRRYLDADQFQRQYPQSYRKWAEAEGLLWGGNCSESGGKLIRSAAVAQYVREVKTTLPWMCPASLNSYLG